MTTIRHTSAPVHIVQISDFHLLGNPAGTMMGINTEDSFVEVLEALSRDEGDIDLCLLTGDLAQDASPATYQRLRQRLGAVPAPCYCLPGNHDDPAVMATALAGANVACSASILLDRWQIICLDSTIPGEAGGHLADRQLQLLARLLERHPERHALVSLHHSPLPTGSRWLDTMMLDNAAELFALLDRHPQVRAVVYGHVHQAMDSMRGKLRLLACPSTCFQFKPHSARFALDDSPQGYRWLTLHPNGELATGVKRLPSVPFGLNMAAGGY